MPLIERAGGALAGLVAARRLALGDAPDGTLALTRILGETLAAGRRDLRALALAWAAEHAARPAGIAPETAAALVHIARHDSPPAQAAGRGSDPLVRTIPVALAAQGTPRTLVSATYHIAALTHPEPAVAWAAVAVNVALARFLSGKRDFVADVIEVLRENDAPATLLALVRRVPLPASAVPAIGNPGDALADLEAAMRLAYHEARLERGLAGIVAGPATAARAGLAGALLGARDGRGALAGVEKERGTLEDWSALAARLTGAA